MKNQIFKIIYKVLAFYARIVIKKHDPFVIAITGSVGKTSTKEAIYTVLSDQFPGEVRKNYGNLNAEIGIPWTILGYEKLPNNFLWPYFLISSYFRTFIKKYPKYLILEMGVEHKGDIEYFCTIARPDIAVVTSVAGAHLANFPDLESFQKEKISIIDNLKPDGKAIVNYDDPVLAKINGPKIISAAVDSEALYGTENVKLSLSGTEFRIATMGHKISVKSALIGKQMIYSQIFAFAVADVLGCPLIGVSKSLEKISRIPGRMNPIEGRNGITIIDDTYNSNPQSAKIALDFLSQVDYKARKVAILGNMNELGDYEERAHEEIGAYTEGKCDSAVFIGKNSDLMRKSFGDEKNSLSFKNRKEFEFHLSETIRKGDLVLVKASQNNNFFEEIVKKLMLKPKDARKLLVRQGNEWNRKK